MNKNKSERDAAETQRSMLYKEWYQYEKENVNPKAESEQALNLLFYLQGGYLQSFRTLAGPEPHLTEEAMHKRKELMSKVPETMHRLSEYWSSLQWRPWTAQPDMENWAAIYDKDWHRAANWLLDRLLACHLKPGGDEKRFLEWLTKVLEILNDWEEVFDGAYAHLVKGTSTAARGSALYKAFREACQRPDETEKEADPKTNALDSAHLCIYLIGKVHLCRLRYLAGLLWGDLLGGRQRPFESGAAQLAGRHWVSLHYPPGFLERLGRSRLTRPHTFGSLVRLIYTRLVRQQSVEDTELDLPIAWIEALICEQAVAEERRDIKEVLPFSSEADLCIWLDGFEARLLSILPDANEVPYLYYDTILRVLHSLEKLMPEEIVAAVVHDSAAAAGGIHEDEEGYAAQKEECADRFCDDLYHPVAYLYRLLRKLLEWNKYRDPSDSNTGQCGPADAHKHAPLPGAVASVSWPEHLYMPRKEFAHFLGWHPDNLRRRYLNPNFRLQCYKSGGRVYYDLMSLEEHELRERRKQIIELLTTNREGYTVFS